MPGPPSPLRQLAYREESQLIGPQGDPKGWMVLNPINFTGNLFNSRQVEVQCTVRDLSDSFQHLIKLYVP